MVPVGNCVGRQGLYITHCALQCDMPQMVDLWLFEYLLDAGLFLRAQQYRCIYS
jgi:hypothetical protein